VTVARLRRADADVFPPLHDVQLVDFKADWFTITGYERLPFGPLGELVSYQQSWFVRPIVKAPLIGRADLKLRQEEPDQARDGQQRADP
jgi:hypothetical protein